MKGTVKIRMNFSNKCERCSYEWVGRKKEPKVCPRCKSYDWRKEK